MSGLESEAMEAEFGTVAAWTEQAVRALGPEYAIPAGCRGRGSEGVLRWLADRLGVRSGARELEALLAGAGFGLTETAEGDLHDSPPSWDERADAVDEEVARRHGGEPELSQAREQARRVARLLAEGALRPWLGAAEAR